jgi:hypothetical protein
VDAHALDVVVGIETIAKAVRAALLPSAAKSESSSSLKEINLTPHFLSSDLSLAPRCVVKTEQIMLTVDATSIGFRARQRFASETRQLDVSPILAADQLLDTAYE